MSDEIKQRIVYILTRKDKADDDDTDIYICWIYLTTLRETVY